MKGAQSGSDGMPDTMPLPKGAAEKLLQDLHYQNPEVETWQAVPKSGHCPNMAGRSCIHGQVKPLSEFPKPGEITSEGHTWATVTVSFTGASRSRAVKIFSSACESAIWQRSCCVVLSPSLHLSSVAATDWSISALPECTSWITDGPWSKENAIPVLPCCFAVALLAVLVAE